MLAEHSSQRNAIELVSLAWFLLVSYSAGQIRRPLVRTLLSFLITGLFTLTLANELKIRFGVEWRTVIDELTLSVCAVYPYRAGSSIPARRRERPTAAKPLIHGPLTGIRSGSFQAYPLGWTLAASSLRLYGPSGSNARLGYRLASVSPFANASIYRNAVSIRSAHAYLLVARVSIAVLFASPHRKANKRHLASPVDTCRFVEIA
jgi:hypothetical protein